MSKATLRVGVIVFTLIAAAAHLFLAAAGLGMGMFGIFEFLFILNGLGYLGLLAAFLGYVPFFTGNNTNWALAGYAAITILSWVLLSGVLGGDPAATNPMPLVTKADEVLLIVAATFHARR